MDEPAASEATETKPKKPRKPTDIKSLGATYALQHQERKMKVYAVTRSELENVAYGNTVAGWAWTTGSGLVTFGFGLWCNMLIESSPSEIATKLTRILIPVFFVLSIPCFIVWYMTTRMRSKGIDEITREQSAETQELPN